jgi:chemotaxis protein methyltransferase CheR
MNEAEVNPVLSSHEIRELQLLIEQRTGILFDQSREFFLVTRVVEHMASKQLSYGMELIRLLRSSNVEYDSLLERLLTQETRFLRYPELFSAFQRQVLPELAARKFWQKDAALRIWSAGCSTGEEPYSIALALSDFFGSKGAPAVSIMATDVSREALARGERGVYPKRVLENLSAPQVAAYFNRFGEDYEVKPMLRAMVKFAPLNLAQPVYLGRFDCIFCMNVLIYFSEELRCQLIRRFYDCLEPGGYLFLGHAESAAGAAVQFQQKFIHGASLLQKPLHFPLMAARSAGETR